MIRTTETVARAEFEFLDHSYHLVEKGRTADEAEAKLLARLIAIRDELDTVIRELRS